MSEGEEVSNQHLWRAVQVVGALAGGAAAGYGSSAAWRVDPVPVLGGNGNGYALESRVRANAEKIAGLEAALSAFVTHVESLSQERERRLIRDEQRIEELYDRDRAADARIRAVEQRR